MFRKFIFLILILLIPASPFLFASDIRATDIKVLFSPEDECGKEILDKINSAEKSIELAIYHLTSRVLSRALVMAVKRGVMVRVFADSGNAAEYYSKVNFLKRNGVLIKLQKGEGLMHNKFCIIDDELVITGSYNWTTSADLKNDENLLFIKSKEIVRLYRVQFEKYWHGTSVDTGYYINKQTLQKHK